MYIQTPPPSQGAAQSRLTEDATRYTDRAASHGSSSSESPSASSKRPAAARLRTQRASTSSRSLLQQQQPPPAAAASPSSAPAPPATKSLDSAGSRCRASASPAAPTARVSPSPKATRHDGARPCIHTIISGGAPHTSSKFINFGCGCGCSLLLLYN
jgi:hypothetical protein